VSSTDFSKRMSDERAQTTSLADYDEFIARTNAAYAGIRAKRICHPATKMVAAFGVVNWAICSPCGNAAAAALHWRCKAPTGVVQAVG